MVTPENIIGLSERDKSLVQAVIDDLARRTIGPSNRPRTDIEDEGYTPTLYIALTPVGGIDGVTLSNTGTPADDVINHEECNIYKPEYDSGNFVYRLRALTGHSRVVFNLGEEDIPGGKWIAVCRDGFGFWYAMTEVPVVCDLLKSIAGYDSTKIQILGHDASGNCKWYDTGVC
jgi:hypothetical protein